jgi:hypothetical protein
MHSDYRAIKPGLNVISYLVLEKTIAVSPLILVRPVNRNHIR